MKNKLFAFVAITLFALGGFAYSSSSEVSNEEDQGHCTQQQCDIQKDCNMKSE